MEAFPDPEPPYVETLSDPLKASSHRYCIIIVINQHIKITVTTSRLDMWNVFLIKDDDIHDAYPTKNHIA
ncbi:MULTISPECIES: hypothetical protein [Rahnella]|uniref:hypothetical protein n=1 Tax=Rahnella TaxID=34037 RepID=UPI00103B3F50|nr:MULTISPECIES: hypothetical protein [Rahnella]QBJ07165.1 hypothetical protein EYS10_01040 [Rahnella aquatilis]QEU49674.1 hypothetical protein EJP80_24335 [Rahnella aquatilis]UNK55907.1 hypothetical protein MNO10_22830 [Rahnella aceris]